MDLQDQQQGPVVVQSNIRLLALPNYITCSLTHRNEPLVEGRGSSRFCQDFDTTIATRHYDIISLWQLYMVDEKCLEVQRESTQQKRLGTFDLDVSAGIKHTFREVYYFQFG